MPVEGKYRSVEHRLLHLKLLERSECCKRKAHSEVPNADVEVFPCDFLTFTVFGLDYRVAQASSVDSTRCKWRDGLKCLVASMEGSYLRITGKPCRSVEVLEVFESGTTVNNSRQLVHIDPIN